MEPLSALAMFCNIIDICDRTVKVCQAAREMYRSVQGRRKQDEALLGYIGELQELLNNMKISSSKVSREDSYKPMVGALDRMEAKSAAVKEILNGFRSNRPGSYLATAIATVKVIRGQGKLDRTLQDLKQCRDEVHFAIAQNTSIQIQEIATRSNQLSEGQRDIQSSLKNLSDRLQNLDKDFSGTRDIVERARGISEQVRTKLCALSILGRLGNTNQRYWDVTKAESHTFHWILRTEDERRVAAHDDEQQPQGEDEETNLTWRRRRTYLYEDTQRNVNAQLRTWLVNGSGLFHISGKPGSGKSTLMKYLVEHTEVTRSLIEWAHPKRLALGYFFFWKPDHGQNTMEALIRGLLQSVIHYDSDLVHSAFPQCKTGSFEQLSLQSRLDITKEEVFQAFDNLVRDSDTAERFRICFFIDGLDEVDDEEDTAHLKIVTTLQQWTDVVKGFAKICLSSRHFPVFDDMPATHRIRLQELTELDIINFVHHSLRYSNRFRTEMTHNAEECRELIDTIVERADGVFLWVSLVVRSIERGLPNADSIATLHDRVKSTPQRLEELFKSLLDSIEDCHAQMAVLLLALATGWLSGPGTRPFPSDLSLSACRNFFHAKETAMGSRIDAVFQADNYPKPFQLTPEIIKSTKSKVSFQCKGLLEAVQDPQFQFLRQPPAEVGDRITFLHRSIPEFLKSWIPKQMNAHGLNSLHVQNAMCWILWAEVRFLNSSINARDFSRIRQSSMRTYVKKLACAVTANLSTITTSESDLLTAFQLLNLAEDELLPSMSPSAQRVEGSSGLLEATWNTISHFISMNDLARTPSYCPMFVSPLLAAAETGCHTYVCWRLATLERSSLHDDHYQHLLEFAFTMLLPSHEFVKGWIGDSMKFATRLIRTTGADINGRILGSDCRCGSMSNFFKEASALPSVFDTIWILFLMHPQYRNVDFQHDAFSAIESLLVLGAVPRAFLCTGTARNWFKVAPSPPSTPDSNRPDSPEFGDSEQIHGAHFLKWDPEPEKKATEELLHNICGQDDGIITLKKLVIYAKPRNMTAIVSLIERASQIENAKSAAARELTPSERLQAATLETCGVRGETMMIWC